MGATMIGSLYTPPASGVSYLAQTVSDFGIVKNSFAQDCERGLGAGCIRVSKASGFGALQPVQKLWISVRNLTFILFVLVFVLIGIGIMLRVKIDPKAVMTLQNQLPKIVVALVLISFSYAIVGLVIDGMWLTTYAGINVITTADNPAGPECNPDAQSLREKSYRNILNYPVAFTSDIFDPDCERATGIGDLSQKVGIAIGTVLDDTLRAIINPSNGDCNPGAIIPGGEDFNWNACAASAFATIVYIIASVLGTLIAFVAMVIALFRLWFTLLKAYAYIIIYTITAPLWIMLGLLPNSSLGFGRWIKTVFANLIIFPLAAFVIITAKIILDAYKVTESEFFVTPLIGNPAVGIMGPLIAFGLILITPELLNTVRDALKTPASKFGGVMQAGFAAGAGPALAPIRAYGSRLTRFDPHKGEVGLVSGAWRNFSSKRLRGIGKYFSGTRKLENEENPLRH